MKSYKTLYRYIFFGLCVLGSAQWLQAFVTAETDVSTNVIAEVLAEKPRRNVYVTVFVHGIISVKPHLNIENMIRFMRDEIENTHYEKTVTLMREDPFFHQNQPMQSQGLRPIAMEPLKRGAGATLLAHVINKIEKISQPNEPTENLYYTFGWSGIMSGHVRYREAKKLYQSLIDLRNSFHAQGIEPHFRIIGYSHGGQVIMVLARVRQHEDVDPSLRIDETLLYGMPVHSFTAEYVNDPLFVKMYNIYSPGDRIQKLDIFTVGEFCSKQIFSGRHIGSKRPKLIQIEMRIIRKAGIYPDVIDEPKSGHFHYTGPRKSYLLRDVSPGHTEMWFFGWTPLHYRPSFPLYPLPIVALTPYIINTLRPLEQEMDPAVPITMMLYPHHNVALLKQHNEKCWDIVPFISADKMYDIRKEIEQYAPIGFTNELYNYHIQIAYDEAHLFHKQRKKDVRRLRYRMKSSPCSSRYKLRRPAPLS